jgi:transposase
MGPPEPWTGETAGRAVSRPAALPGRAGRHPQALILLSQPGLGVVLAARLLGEFGDDRLADACTL